MTIDPLFPGSEAHADAVVTVCLKVAGSQSSFLKPSALQRSLPTP